ncbi:MAG: hypothetical protein SF029_23500 [bacterium]|nr:hypothetical protein [bacterium]
MKILERSAFACEWKEAGQICGLVEGDTDPIGGGRVRLTPDHKTPHSFAADIDPTDPDQWQALCGRHQVIKKNYWDNRTGKLNVSAIIQAASREEKHMVLRLLLDYFGYTIQEDGTIVRR